MNKIFKKFLLTGNKLIPEVHLWKPRFTYSTCRKFPKYRERIQTFKLVIYRNELHKACFAHDAVYAGSKNIANRIVSDKVLKGRVYEISLYHKYGGYQKWLASVVRKFFDKKTRLGGRMTRKTEINVNEVLPPELLKQVIK